MTLDPSKLSFAAPTFNSYKEYDRATVGLSITGTVPAGQSRTFSATVTFKRVNSITSIEFTTSVASVFHSITETYSLIPDTNIFHVNGSTPTFPGSALYNIGFQNSFASDSVTFTAVVVNPNAETLTVVNELLTVTAYSIIAPFQTPQPL